MKKYISMLLVILTGIVLLTGCRGKEEEVEDPMMKTNDNIQHVELGSLQSGMFYVRTRKNEKDLKKGESADRFYPVHAEHATFRTNKLPMKPSPDRVLWFTDDEELIPTIYEDDALIYVAALEMPRKITWERFEDVGYSIGIAGLQKNESSKLQTQLNSEWIHPTSEAGATIGRITNEEVPVVIETIGKNRIDKSDLTRAGTINGMKKDASYEVGAYVGTGYYPFLIKADTRVMISYELFETVDYEYNTDGYVEIEIPDYFHSGYYFINGVGVFRYVKGPKEKGIEGIDFNDPYFLGVDEDGNIITADGIDHTIKDEEEEEDTEDEGMKEKEQASDVIEDYELVLNGPNIKTYTYNGPNGKIEFSVDIEGGTILTDTEDHYVAMIWDESKVQEFIDIYEDMQDSIEFGTSVVLETNFLESLITITGDKDPVKTLRDKGITVIVDGKISENNTEEETEEDEETDTEELEEDIE